MAIIQQYHKDTDTTYVYESVSYWDAEKGQSRSRRRCIGKIDPATGEMVPTGKRGRKKKEASASDELARVMALYDQARAEAARLAAENSRLSAELSSMSGQNQKLRTALKRIQDTASDSLS